MQENKGAHLATLSIASREVTATRTTQAPFPPPLHIHQPLSQKHKLKTKQGASWIEGITNNPLYEIAEDNALETVYSDWDDLQVYKDGVLVDRSEYTFALDYDIKHELGLSWKDAFDEAKIEESRMFNWSVVYGLDDEWGADMFHLDSFVTEEGGIYGDYQVIFKKG